MLMKSIVLVILPSLIVVRTYSTSPLPEDVYKSGILIDTRSHAPTAQSITDLENEAIKCDSSSYDALGVLDPTGNLSASASPKRLVRRTRALITPFGTTIERNTNNAGTGDHVVLDYDGGSHYPGSSVKVKIYITQTDPQTRLRSVGLW